MDNQDLIWLNAVTVIKEEIENVANEINHYHEEKFDAESFSDYITTVFFDGNRQKADAVLFRLSAFATLSSNNDLTAWASRHGEDNSVSIHPAIFSAAACEPLIRIDGQISFKVDTFLKRVLEMAKTNGSIQ